MESYSVLMSVHPGERPEFLSAAIRSMLGQTVPPDDFVLVCDGRPSPALEEVVLGFEARYPHVFQVVRLPEPRGLGAALNIGLRACRREVVARMDSDDLALPTRMAQQLAALEADPKLSIVGGQIAEFSEEPHNITGYRLVPRTHGEILAYAGFRSPMNHVTVTFRKRAVLAAGSYCDFGSFEDYHLWARMLAGGARFANLGQVCVCARVDQNTYRRRSGLAYFHRAAQMEAFLQACGLIDTARYWANLTVRFAGAVLAPNLVRRTLYNTLLRRRHMPREWAGMQESADRLAETVYV